MTEDLNRLQRRIARDFPEPGSARGVQLLLDEFVKKALGDRAQEAQGARLQAAVVLLAAGDLGLLRSAIALGLQDWRDLLVAAELADADYPDRLDLALGPERDDTASDGDLPDHGASQPSG